MAPFYLLLVVSVCTLLGGCDRPEPVPATTVVEQDPAALTESEPPTGPTSPTSPAAAELSAIHISPGDDLQAALDQAAESQTKIVLVHAGTYRPSEPRQALIWLNRRHDGIHLKAVGDVTLTAANAQVAKRNAKSFPAIVNHVIYCGDGLGEATIIEGFKITGANNFTTTKGPAIESVTDPALQRTAYFYYDGGGVKIFGRSYPTLVGLEITDNYSSPCGAGVSVEHRGFRDRHVTIRNCIFRNNRVPLTGAALDLLGDDLGSAAVVENCLFVDNAANCSMDDRSLKLGSWKPQRGHGAITVFTRSKLVMRDCTMIGNRNGVDDTSPDSSYERCIFWKNDQDGGWPRGARYEIAVAHPGIVRDCIVHGTGEPPRLGTSNIVSNELDPQFDANFTPANALFQGKGYRPVEQSHVAN